MRGTFRIAVVAAKVGAILLLAGCRFEVKDIGGLQAYVTDAECAKLRAIEMRAHFPDPASVDYLRVRALYSEAVAQANSFVRSVQAGVDISKPVVNVPKTRYDQHEASAKLAEFIRETGKLRSEYFSRQGQELGKALEKAATDALDQATAEEKAATVRLESQKELLGRVAQLQKKYADLLKAFDELKATGQRQGTIVAEEYAARVVPEDYIPSVEQAVKDAAGLGLEALDLLAELQKDLTARDGASLKLAGQRKEALEAIMQAAAGITEHEAEPVPDSSGLMMQGTRIAVPVITEIIQLNGNVSRDGVARFDGIMERIQLPDFDKLSSGRGA